LTLRLDLRRGAAPLSTSDEGYRCPRLAKAAVWASRGCPRRNSEDPINVTWQPIVTRRSLRPVAQGCLAAAVRAARELGTYTAEDSGKFTRGMGR